jgi:hypothetical protein
MDKALICKIVVTTTSGKRIRGTGYPVARDRIITAAHVVENWDRIELYFGESNEPLHPEVPPKVCWNGMREGYVEESEIDVAVIECLLPESLAPRGITLAAGSLNRTDYQGCGFSEKVRSEKNNGFYDFDGSFPAVTGESDQECVDCKNGPKAIEGISAGDLWGGVSGTCLFEVDGKQQLLAVVTDFVDRYALPRLRVVPLPFLLRDEAFRDAIRYGESTDSKQRNAQARERLRVRAEPVLESSVTRKFILKCNDLTDAMSAKALAKKIFDSPEPMSFLRRCVRQGENRDTLSANELTELNTSMCRLAELASPVCFGQEDLEDLERHLNQQTSHANVQTQDLTVAKSRVAFIKRVSVNLDDSCKWDTINHDQLTSGREHVTAVPHPPELGIYADKAKGQEDIVEAFATVLIRMLQPASPTLPRVQAALKDLAEYDKVFLIVLFTMPLSAANLNRLHETFPELILLVAEETTDDAPHQRILDQIQRIREEFGPQARKQA